MPPIAAAGPAARPPRPREVDVAFWLWLAGVAVGVITSVVLFASLGDAVRAQVEQDVAATPGLSPGDVETIVRYGLIVGAVVGVLALALQVFFAVAMRAGRNWARIVLSVLGAVSVALNVTGLGSAGALQAALALVQSALVVSALVFMYTGTTRDYFGARRPSPP